MWVGLVSVEFDKCTAPTCLAKYVAHDSLYKLHPERLTATYSLGDHLEPTRGGESERDSGQLPRAPGGRTHAPVNVANLVVRCGCQCRIGTSGRPIWVDSAHSTTTAAQQDHLDRR